MSHVVRLILGRICNLHDLVFMKAVFFSNRMFTSYMCVEFKALGWPTIISMSVYIVLEVVHSSFKFNSELSEVN